MSTIEPSNRFQTREYQQEIFEACTQRNSIVFLPTGSGKTFISALLVKYFSRPTCLPLDKGGRRTFFLACTVPLMIQQATALEKLLPFKIGYYSGEINYKYCSDPVLWKQELEEKQVIVMTAQVFLDLLSHSYMKLIDVNLLILDECHHATRNHPYRQVMKLFQNCPVPDRPHVVGLTATLLNANSKPGQVKIEVRDLEVTLLSKVVTVSNPSMANAYAANPSTRIIMSVKPSLDEATLVFFKDLHDYASVIFKYLAVDATFYNVATYQNQKKSFKKNLLKKIIGLEGIYSELGSYPAVLAINLALKAFHNIALLWQVLRPVTLYLCTQVTAIKKHLCDQMESTPPENRAIVHSSMKIGNLLKLLLHMKEGDYALVFVQKRFTVLVLYSLVKELSENFEQFSHLKCGKVVGYSAESDFVTTDNPFASVKENNAILKLFNEGSLNLLFATDVLEEGIDIQSCNYVIKFDQLLTFRSYIQSKGRARNKESEFIILDEKDCHQKLHSFDLVKRDLEEIIKLHRVDVSESDAEDELYGYDLPPFAPFGPNGPQISELTAISLINKYCQSLPQDKFSCLTVVFTVRGEDGCLSASLRFPLNCPIKGEVEGPLCEFLTQAKRAVALKAVELLFSLGELDEFLKPVGRKSELLNLADLYPKWDGADPKAFPGTRKCERFYPKYTPKLMRSCLSEEGNVSYLHVVQMTLKETPTPSKDPIALKKETFLQKLFSTPVGFGIVTTSPWHQTANFSLFTSFGLIEVELVTNSMTFTLNRQITESLLEFHSSLFKEFLQLRRDESKDQRKDDLGKYLVAPVIYQGGRPIINWGLVNKHLSLKPTLVKAESPYKYHPGNYKNKILFPNYRGSSEVLGYLNIEECSNLNPLSIVSKRKKVSHVSYFQEKYQASITNMEQPLLLVAPLSRKMSFYHPTKDMSKFSENFVPELSKVVDFPADYALKATLLPCALHRISRLLLAEELRGSILTQMKSIAPPMDTGRIPTPHEWERNAVEAPKVREEVKIQREPWAGRSIAYGMYTFSGNNEEEMSFEEGDYLVVVPAEVSRPGWIRAKKDDKEGLIPSFFVEIFESDTLALMDDEVFIVTKEYQAANSIELSLQSKDLVILHTKETEEEGWWKGAVDGRFGNFPASCVEPYEQVEVFKALKDYRAALPSELTMKKGSLITIKSKKLDVLGWWKGSCGKKTGLFPRDVVISVENEETVTVLESLPPRLENGDSAQVRADIEAFMRSLNPPNAVKNSGPAERMTKCPEIKENPLLRKSTSALPSQSDFFEAITANSAAEVVNYERLETLGDAFLKFSVSYFLFKTYPDKNEGQLTAVKCKLVGNRYLFYCGREINLESFINSESFTASEWDSPARNEDEPADVEMSSSEFRLSDKVVSDCVEALIGVFIKVSGLDMAEKFLKWVGVLSEVPQPPVGPDYSDVLCIMNIPSRDKIEETLGYTFVNPMLLLEALTHASMTFSLTGCYQRLEFLGDSVIDFLITTYIFHCNPTMTPGDLTDLRSALVNNTTFACICVRLGLHKHLNVQNCALMGAMTKFASVQDDRQNSIGPEVLLLINDDDAKVSEMIDTPKVLGDIVESIIGAVFLDSGSLETTWRVLYGMMWDEIETFSKNVPKNSIRLLYERFIIPPPQFSPPEVLDNDLVGIELSIVDEGKESKFIGLGCNSKAAKLAAAKFALRELHRPFREDL